MGGAHREPIGAQWLADVLGTAPSPVTVTEIGTGIGLLGSLSRVQTDDGRSYIVKRSSGDEGNRAIAHRLGYYAREAGTYRDLLPRPGVRTATCHAVVEGPDGPVLVLEDLGALRPGDQLAGASPAEARAAVDWAASLHAAFWNAPELAACPWLPGPPDPVVSGFGRLLELTWDAFATGMAGEVPADQLAAAEVAATGFDRVVASFGAAPRTLLHGDLRLDNLLFEPAGDAVAVDWQLAQWGRGPYDLAFFLAGSLAPEARRAQERDLLARYHRQLHDRGVSGYSAAQCWQDYLGGLVMNLPNPVTALVAVAGGTERGRRLLRANARRAVAAVADHASSLSSW